MPYPTDQLPDAQPSKWTFSSGRLLKSAPLVVVTAMLGLCVAGIGLRSVQALYTSSISILIDPKRPGAFGADTEFANVYIDSAKVASVETVLLSSDLLLEVARTLHLDDDPAFSRIKTSPLKKIAPFLVAKGTVAQADTPPARLARAVDTLRRMIKTGRIGSTYIIKVDVTASDPTMAQRIAKVLADTYLGDLVLTKRQAADNDSAWLTSWVGKQRSQLIQSEVTVEDIRKKLGIMATDKNAESSIDRQSVTQVNDDLVKAQGDLSAAQARYEQAQSIMRTGGNIQALSDIADSRIFETLRDQQAQAARRMADASVRYGSHHPAFRQAESERTAADHQLGVEVSRIVASLKNNYQIALTHRDLLAKQVTKFVDNINATATAAGRIDLREAERVAEANRVAYDAALNHARDVAQQATRLDAEARIISDADVSDIPSFPKPLYFLGGGAAVGVLFGAGLVVLWSRVRVRVEDANTAERELLLPVLAVIPNVRHPRDKAGRAISLPEYLVDQPFSAFADSLRLLRLRFRPSPGGGGQVVQFTSAVPGEGKSTIASSLAISASAAGLRTILIDLDLHRPSAANLLGHEPGAGMIEILGAGAEADSVTRTHRTLPIQIIGAGLPGALKPGLVESAQLRNIVSRLRAEYDLVVVDTPPVLAISDPIYVSTLVDMTILVVEWRSTPRAIVDDALAALRSAQASIAGIVLNKAEPVGPRGYDKRHYGYERILAA